MIILVVRFLIEFHFTFLKFVYYSRVEMWEDVLISCGRLAGEYLGLTGARLDGADMLSCGLATHFVPSQVILFTTYHNLPSSVSQ